MAAALGGLDALVFSGGIGEHQPRLRTRIAGGLGFLGLALDARRNAAADGDTDISADGATVRTVVVAAREDRVIAAGARTALSQQGRDR
jgi:acetate kinase